MVALDRSDSVLGNAGCWQSQGEMQRMDKNSHGCPSDNAEHHLSLRELHWTIELKVGGDRREQQKSGGGVSGKG
ncbi:hypothetical protein [Rhizobium sp. R693]|uniref:hypothetical protein n=1 Tax=Rhizobium sp. R693 TaxID=1764276 RepID=UPI00113211A8|nr:hypothetical protein [Rhizobium sp. R693]